MENRLLVLVPHQDDELNIAGQVLPTFLEAGYECKICFSTNGDGFKSNGPVRLKEAQKVADFLGVGKENLIFLGFDDSMGPDHPYNRTCTDAASAAPPVKTYSESIRCYSDSFAEQGLPQCRETLVADISHLLDSWRPDTIICIDYDSHPDHRALSLAFEEAIGRVMHLARSYRPLILKKFAYSSVWYGPADYWTYSPTVRQERCGSFELDNPMYAWEDRICVAPHPSAITRSFFSNSVVKAAMRYPSQNGWFYMASVCNADVIYWVRRTDDFMLEAKVKCSSGDGERLADFQLFESSDVCSKEAKVLTGGRFQFREDDVDRAVHVGFDGPRPISEIIVREAVGSFGGVSGISISIDGGPARDMPRTEIHSGRFVLSFGESILAHTLDFRFGRGRGLQKIASIEVYPTPMGDYLPLRDFERLMGVPVKMRPSKLHLEVILRQVAKVTMKVQNTKLLRREKRLSN